MSNDIKFKTRDRGKVVIAEYRGVSEGATLCWWQKDDSLVVWDIARWMDWEGTIRGHYFKLDGTQNLAAILDHPTDHNAQALHDAKLELAKRKLRIITTMILLLQQNLRVGKKSSLRSRV